MAADKLERAISGVDFPATKEDILRRAGRNHASEEILRRLNSLPDIRYNSLARIEKILGGNIPEGEDVSPATTRPGFYQTIDTALRELHFPATKEQLLEESKRIKVLWGKSELVIPLKDFLEELEEEEYNKPEEIMDEVNALIRKSSELEE